MDWFMKSVASSVVPFPGCPGVGRYITILSISFIPPAMGMRTFRLDCGDGFVKYADHVKYSSSEVECDLRDYWERFTDAVQNMAALHTLCLCYDDAPWGFTMLDAYSECADAFSPSLKTLILRPLKNKWVSN
jgi:hypothetical protein